MDEENPHEVPLGEPERMEQEQDLKDVDNIEDDELADSDESMKKDPLDKTEKEDTDYYSDAQADTSLLSSAQKKLLTLVACVAAGLAIAFFLLAAFIIDFDRAVALFVCTVTTLVYLGYAYLAEIKAESFHNFFEACHDFMERTDEPGKFKWAFTSFLVVIMVIVLAVTVESGRNLVSLFGLFVYIVLVWLFSWKRHAVKLRPILVGVFMQFLFGYCVIRTKWGFKAIEFLSEVFITLLGYTYAGSSFVFGYLTDGSLFDRPFQLAGEDAGTYFLGPPFFFNVLPTVIFFSSLMSVGYYLRVMPFLVKKLGYFLALLMGTSASESLSAAGNIFLGQTEAPLLVKPFMKDMTESELHAIMTGGFSTIAGSVFGIYVFMGIDATALLAASVMSAPAALAISKLMYPETEESKTDNRKKGAFEVVKSDDINVVDAACKGAVTGMQLAINIAANLIAFLAIIEMFNELIIYLGERVDREWSLYIFFEYIFYPFAFLMGVDPEDCREVGNIIGLKVIANEFVAYDRLSQIQGQISDRSFYIATYATAGFSNLSSIGIQIGGLTPLAPNQGHKLAKVGFSAMIAGNVACFMTACIAGLFYEDDSQAAVN